MAVSVGTTAELNVGQRHLGLVYFTDPFTPWVAFFTLIKFKFYVFLTSHLNNLWSITGHRVPATDCLLVHTVQFFLPCCSQSSHLEWHQTWLSGQEDMLAMKN